MSVRSVVIKKALDYIKPELKSLVDDTVKGLLRSIGDPGADPVNFTGKTILRWLQEISYYTKVTKDALLPRSAYNTSVGTALSVTLSLYEDYKGRSLVAVCVKSTGTGSFRVFGSHDNMRYWLIDTID